MIFAIIMAVFIILFVFALVWLESDINNILKNHNVRLLYLERKREEDKERHFLVVEKTREMENRVRILEITKKR